MPATEDYSAATSTYVAAMVGTGFADTDLDSVFDNRVYYGTAYHVASVTIPQGATILTAYWTCYNPLTWLYTDPTWRATFYCVASDDETTLPTTFGQANAYSVTTGVDWTKSSGFTVPINSPNLAAAFQDIVDRAGWASGNDMVLLWKDNGSDPPIDDPLYPYGDPTYNTANLGTAGASPYHLNITYIA